LPQRCKGCLVFSCRLLIQLKIIFNERKKRTCLNRGCLWYNDRYDPNNRDGIINIISSAFICGSVYFYYTNILFIGQHNFLCRNSLFFLYKVIIYLYIFNSGAFIPYEKPKSCPNWSRPYFRRFAVVIQGFPCTHRISKRRPKLCHLQMK